MFPIPPSIVVGYFEKRPVCSYGFSFPLVGYYSLVGESQFSPTKGGPRVDVILTQTAMYSRLDSDRDVIATRLRLQVDVIRE